MRILLLSLLVSYVSLAADEKAHWPAWPNSGEDEVLTGKLSAKEFFQKRQADKPCQTALDKARTADKDAYEAMTKAVANKRPAAEIDGLETDWRAVRDTFLDSLEKCGECATRKVEHTERTPEGSNQAQTWDLYHGSCWHDGLSAEQLKKGFEAASASLVRPAAYPRATGGFRSILNFNPINATTGKEIAGVKKMDFPFTAFVALRAFEAFGRVAGYSQLMTATFEEPKGAAVFKFETTAKPKGFRPPTVVEVTAGGRRKPVTLLPLNGLRGMWFVNDQGYVRYFTASEFGVGASFADELARRTLLETVYEFSRRLLSR